MKIPIFKNTFSGYLLTIIRMVEGIVVSRWIIEFLGVTQYGLWALLWSIFAYALLLDLGYGATAQKFTSGGLWKKDNVQYSNIISCIFSFHCMMGGLIIIITVVCSFFLEWILKTSDPEAFAYGRSCFWIMGICSAVLFTTGLFSEILVGLQKIYVKNNIIAVSKLIELAGCFLIFKLGGDLRLMLFFFLMLSLGSNIAMAVIVFRSIPLLRLRLRMDKESLRSVAGFSAYVYTGVLCRLIINKSSRLLISFFYNLSSVGIFHISSKLADLCIQGTGQYQENIAPISSALHQRGKYQALGNIILGAMRWNGFLAFGGTLFASILTPELMRFLFKVDDPQINSLSRLFLFSMYISAVFRAVPHRYFLMAGRHRFATGIVAWEAGANLALNLLMLPFFSFEIVLLNSIVIKLVLILFFILPELVKTLKISFLKLLFETIGKPLLASVPSLLWMTIFFFSFPDCSIYGSIFICGGIAGVLYLIAMGFSVPKLRRKRTLARLNGFLRIGKRS